LHGRLKTPNQIGVVDPAVVVIGEKILTIQAIDCSGATRRKNGSTTDKMRAPSLQDIPMTQPTRMAIRLLVVWLASGFGTLATADEPASSMSGARHPGYQALVDRVVEEGVPVDYARAWVGQARIVEQAAEQARRPAESVMTYERYRAIFYSAKRIERARGMLERYKPLFHEAEARYGVDREVIAAILAVETDFGRFTGVYRVLDALVTQSLTGQGPRRPFFTRELANFLMFTREEGQDPQQAKGSYAGASGICQMIPSTFRSYAVDMDGDGSRDIWTSMADAIGSTANYLRRYKFERGGALVDVAGGGSGDLLELQGWSKPWREGVNFRAVYAWNHAAPYVAVVAEIASALRGEGQAR